MYQLETDFKAQDRTAPALFILNNTFPERVKQALLYEANCKRDATAPALPTTVSKKPFSGTSPAPLVKHLPREGEKEQSLRARAAKGTTKPTMDDSGTLSITEKAPLRPSKPQFPLTPLFMLVVVVLLLLIVNQFY